ncbi:MAG: hypothetical protein QNK11_01675, partial [Legionella sp.]|nr:hypothetical protein [Legionella sp.]
DLINSADNANIERMLKLKNALEKLAKNIPANLGAPNVKKTCDEIITIMDSNESDLTKITTQLNSFVEAMPDIPHVAKTWAECKGPKEVASYIMHAIESAIRGFLTYFKRTSNTADKASENHDNYFFKAPKKAKHPDFDTALAELATITHDVAAALNPKDNLTPS